MKLLNRSIFILFLFTFLAHLACSQEVEPKYKPIVHKFNEAWNTGNVKLLDDVVHPEYLKLEGDLELRGIEQLKDFVRNYRESYRDIKITYIDEVYGNEKVAINFTIAGTPIETNKRFEAEGMVIFRFRDGKIIEDHSVFDQLSALKQQGYKIEEPE